MAADLDKTAFGLPGVPEVSKYDGAPPKRPPQSGAHKQEAVTATMNHVMGKFFGLATERLMNTASVDAVLDTLQAVLTTMRAIAHVHNVRDFVQSLTTAVNISETLEAASMPQVQTSGGYWPPPAQLIKPEQLQQASRSAEVWEPDKEDLLLCALGSANDVNFRWQADMKPCSVARKMREESSSASITSAISAVEEKLKAHFISAQQLLLQDLAARQQETLQSVMCQLKEEFGLSRDHAKRCDVDSFASASGGMLRGAADATPQKRPSREVSEGPLKPALPRLEQSPCQPPGQPPQLVVDSSETGVAAVGESALEVVADKKEKRFSSRAAGTGSRRLLHNNTCASIDEIMAQASIARPNDSNPSDAKKLRVQFSSANIGFRGESTDKLDLPALDRTRTSLSHTYILLPTWNKKHTRASPNAERAAADIRFQMQVRMEHDDLRTSRASDIHPSMRVSEGAVTCYCPMIHPHSKLRIFWDIFSLTLVIYDMIAIPFGFFEPPESDFLDTMAWVTRIFWTVDMFVHFATGQVLQDGTIEMRPKAIAWRYLRTWFLLDVIINGSDWLEVIISATTTLSYARMGKASRIFRIVRLIRLLRLVRMSEVVKQMVERIQSEAVLVLADCAKIMLCIIGLAHIIACFWYGVGVGSDDEANWLDKHEEYHNSSLGYRYTSTLHWSLQQFGGGTDEVVPQNVAERVYAIVAWIFAYMVATMFLGRLTYFMTRLSFLSNQHNQQLYRLRKYMAQIGISRRLALRVQRNAQHAMRENLKFQAEDNVELLDQVSEPLRMELHFETYSQYLRVHPFFHMFIDVCPQVMMKVCHQAASVQLFSAGDTIFHAGEYDAESKMLVICKGELLYAPIYGDRCNVGKDDWVSEACLWTEWVHQGVLVAYNNCRICQLDSQLFQDISSRFSGHEFDPRPYALAFVTELNERAQCEGGYLSDLPMSCESQIVSKLVMAAKHNARHGVYSDTPKGWGGGARKKWRQRTTFLGDPS